MSVASLRYRILQKAPKSWDMDVGSCMLVVLGVWSWRTGMFLSGFKSKGPTGPNMGHVGFLYSAWSGLALGGYCRVSLGPVTVVLCRYFVIVGYSKTQGWKGLHT